jgi:conflict system pore-forming effector with SLATT domain
MVDNLIVEMRIEKAQILGRAHAMAADSYDTRQKWLAIPTIILSTIVGASAIASLGDFGKVKFWLDLVICIFSITVAVLTGLQQYLDYATRSQKHADTAAGLFAISRKWELVLNRKIPMAEVEALERELATRIEKSPRVSIELQQRAQKAVMREKLRNDQRYFVAELHLPS